MWPYGEQNRREQNRTLLHSGRPSTAYVEYAIYKLYNICDKIGLTGARI